MTSPRMSRALVAVASLLFAGVALVIWAAPAPVAHALGLEPVRSGGAAMVRADLGGLFAGLSLLCAAAAWTRGAPWSLAAAAMLGAIAVGRTLGWVSNGRFGPDLPELLLELVLIGALLALARSAAARASSASVARPRSTIPLVAIGVVSLLATTALVSPRVQGRIFEAAAAERAATVNAAPLADDALRVAICGSSAPLPSSNRAKACVAVFAGGRFYLVDVGPESVENLVTWGIPLSAVGGVLLTHFHSDHIGDLGELNLQTWAGGRPGPLPVFGGPGVERALRPTPANSLDRGTY